jgi:hypothetical protein
MDNKSLHRAIIASELKSNMTFPKGMIVEGEVFGVITVTICTVDELFMLVQYYFDKVINIAKQLGTIGVVVNLEGFSTSNDWSKLMLEYGLVRSRGSADVYIAGRNDLQVAVLPE